MTDEEKANDLQLFGARHASDDAPARGVLATVAAILLLVVVLVGLDVVSDERSGGSRLHLALELLLMTTALGGIALLGRALVSARGRARALAQDLTSARADASRFRAESEGYLRGLAAAIDHQFDRWALTGAEREVALLLLKGLSSKEIASVRATSERTVRQQALAVYRKAGLAGRAELAAFFLEDLLQPATGAGAPQAETVP